MKIFLIVDVRVTGNWQYLILKKCIFGQLVKENEPVKMFAAPDM